MDVLRADRKQHTFRPCQLAIGTSKGMVHRPTCRDLGDEAATSRYESTLVIKNSSGKKLLSIITLRLLRPPSLCAGGEKAYADKVKAQARETREVQIGFIGFAQPTEYEAQV